MIQITYQRCPEFLNEEGQDILNEFRYEAIREWDRLSGCLPVFILFINDFIATKWMEYVRRN